MYCFDHYRWDNLKTILPNCMRRHMLQPADHRGMVLGVYVRGRVAVPAAKLELNSRCIVDRRRHGDWVLHNDMGCIRGKGQAPERVLQAFKGHLPG